jgi:putative ABC transport system permease protein
VRVRDVVGLALVALRQRRLRTALTTVGVAVGSFVLLTSLAIGEGVQAVLLGQLRKQDHLRRIYVWPGGGPPAKMPESELEVPGEMTDARRERLREAIRRRWEAPARKQVAPGLTAKQVQALQELPHVEAVAPAFSWNGTVELWGRTVTVNVRATAEDDPGLRRRIVAGRTFAPGEPAMYLSEYALYKLGVGDEAEVKRALNQEARLTLTVTQPNLGSLLFLLGVSRPDLAEREQRLLKKVIAQLPSALGALNLSAAERRELAELLRESRPESTRAVERRLPVVGICRDVARTELGPWDGPPRPVDVILSPVAAKEAYFAIPGRAQSGLPQVTVRVDREENLREVEAKIKEMGMETFSFADLMEQVRLNVLLVAVGSTLVAIVSLLVAALGITNTMLMSVLERTHEIGVMKATGARDGEVEALFLMEGALLGFLGAALGMIASWLVSFPGDRLAQHLVALKTPMRLEESVFVYPAWLLLGAPALVCVLTTLAAVYPARRAAKIDPVEALRQR